MLESRVFYVLEFKKNITLNSGYIYFKYLVTLSFPLPIFMHSANKLIGSVD